MKVEALKKTSHSHSENSNLSSSVKHTGPRLSVIICTYDRYEALSETLSVLLTSGGLVDAETEVLVVENTPPDRRLPISVGPPGKARIEVCETVGLSAARNFGIEHTTGDIVAFLDDDAVVCDDWCHKVLHVFDEHPKVMAAGGKVVPRYSLTQMPAWYNDDLAGYLSCVDWSLRPRFLRDGEWIVGANMAFRREVFQRYGNFNTSLGRKGASSLLSNDETALFEQIGIRNVYYSPDMFVHHVIPTGRLTPDWFRRRVFWQAVSDLVAGLVKPGDPGLRKEYGEVIGRLEASRRNLNALCAEPRDSEEFRLQLRGIYLAAVALGGGC